MLVWVWTCPICDFGCEKARMWTRWARGAWKATQKDNSWWGNTLSVRRVIKIWIVNLKVHIINILITRSTWHFASGNEFWLLLKRNVRRGSVHEVRNVIAVCFVVQTVVQRTRAAHIVRSCFACLHTLVKLFEKQSVWLNAKCTFDKYAIFTFHFCWSEKVLV